MAYGFGQLRPQGPGSVQTWIIPANEKFLRLDFFFVFVFIIHASAATLGCFVDIFLHKSMFFTTETCSST